MEINRTQCTWCESTNSLLFSPRVVLCFDCKAIWANEKEGKTKTYSAEHICRCELFDRKTCPACHKPCHHDGKSVPQLKPPKNGGSSDVETHKNTEDDKKEMAVIK